MGMFSDEGVILFLLEAMNGSQKKLPKAMVVKG